MRTKYILFLLVALASLNACKNTKDEVGINALDGLVKLKEAYAIGASAKVEIWGKKNFFVGYNNITAVVYDSINTAVRITDAHIHFVPIVTTTGGATAIEKASPVENPNETAVNGVFPGAISFIKASDANNTWKLTLLVHNHKADKEGEVTFDISVDNPSQSLLTTFTSTSADASQFALFLVKPSTPKLGVNAIELALYKNGGLLEWTVDNSYTVEIYPVMPDMGPESPNNIVTTNAGNGHYTGSFELSMSGLWNVNVFVKKNGTTISPNFYFAIKL